MKIKIILLVLFLTFTLKSQIIPFTVNLDSSVTRTLDSAMIYVKNPTNKILNVTSIRNTSPQFFTRVNSFSVAAFDSTGIWALFSSHQNLTYRSFLIFETNSPSGGLKSSVILGLIATAKYSGTQYLFTQGLIDEDLKTALHNWTTNGYVSLGYNVARDRMFESIDKYLANDTIECVYIGRKIRALNRTEAQNQGFNTEHTYPQSFFNSNEPMVSDLFHLYPTDNVPNSMRANYPFGFVVSGITYQNGGSKLGRDSSNNIVFEPRTIHKGNVARSLFYFTVKYTNLESYMNQIQENALRQFNVIDTVDANEILRNSRIQVYQHVRNPFIDHPEFIERIRSTFQNAPTILKPEISASPFTIKFDTVTNANDSTSYYLAIMNYGTANLSITSISSNNSAFTIVSYPSTVFPNQYGISKIKFQPPNPNSVYNGTLTIFNNDETITVNLFGVCGNPIGIHPVSNEIPSRFSLSQNYPNPFNPKTVISFQLAANSFTSIKIYDLLGHEVETLVNEKLQAGIYEVSFDASNLPSGIYFYRMSAGDFTETKRMVLMK